MTLSLVTTSHLHPLGPGWPFKGVRAEQAVGSTALFSEGPEIKTESGKKSGGWGGWQDAEGRGLCPHVLNGEEGAGPPASIQKDS